MAVHPNGTIQFSVFSTPEFRTKAMDMISSAVKIFANEINNPVILVMSRRDWRVVISPDLSSYILTYERRKGRFTLLMVEDSHGVYKAPQFGSLDRRMVSFMSNQLMTLAQAQKAELQRLDIDLK